jgi:hypothetical protein
MSTALVPAVRPVTQPEYRPLSDAQRKVNRELRDRIDAYLDTRYAEIEYLRLNQKKCEAVLEMRIDFDLGEKIFSRDKMADIVRRWVLLRFKGKLGLEEYRTLAFGSLIRFSR